MDVKLVMFKSNGQRKDFPIINPTTVIGRGENCDLRVPLLSVSRRHTELALEGDQVKVKDLGSSNGTYVNNERINESALRPGDRLVIGPIVFTVQIDGKPEQIRPVKTRGQVLAEEGEPGTEEIVELEDDVVAQPGASVLEEAAPTASADAVEAVAVAADGEPEDIDPISALEALASESEGQEEEEEEEK